MCNEAYHDMTHDEMSRFVLRHLALIADTCSIEHKLPNGRIADLHYTLFDKHFIIEIKTELKYSLMQSAYTKYAKECHYLIIGAPKSAFRQPPDFILAGFPDVKVAKIGLWSIDWMGINEERRALRLG